MNKLQEEFDNICFELKQAQDELEEIRADLFVLNPKIKKLTAHIKELKNRKDELWRTLQDEETE